MAVFASAMVRIARPKRGAGVGRRRKQTVVLYYPVEELRTVQGTYCTTTTTTVLYQAGYGAD